MDWLFTVEVLQMLARLALSCAAFALVVAMLGGLRRPDRSFGARREPPDLGRPDMPAADRARSQADAGEEARS
jgi:hypothetical protein